MHRKCFALLLASALIIVTAAPRPAKAIVPVFDAGNFAHMVDLLVQEKLITEQNAANLYRDYQMVTELYANGHPNIDVIWNIIQPDIDRIDSQVAHDQFIRNLANYMVANFSNGTGWQPGIPYNVLLTSIVNNEQQQLGQVIQDTFANEAADTAHQQSMKQLMNTMHNAKGTVDAVNVVGSELDVIEGTISELNHTQAEMLRDMNSYYTLQLEKDKASTQSVGNNLLLETIGKAPDQLSAQNNRRGQIRAALPPAPPPINLTTGQP